METWDALRSRRQVREFVDKPLDAADLDQILEAGRRSPSSRNKQRWDFVVCTDRDRLQELSKVWQGAKPVATSAATIALIAPRSDDAHTKESVQFDLGMVMMSMMLTATDLGIGSGQTAVVDQQLAADLLGFPDDRFCAWLLALGHIDGPLNPILRPKRRPFEEVVHRERW
jgi:nitroreductase